jgi:MarR family transcriptional regulator for hemolysin
MGFMLYPERPDLRLRRRQVAAWIGLASIHRKMEARAVSLFKENGLLDITPSQSTVLMILFERREPMTARALAKALGLSEVTVGRFIRNLLKAGWVRRQKDPADARALLLSPTEKAYGTLPTFIAMSNAQLDQAFGGFSSKEVKTMVDLVTQIRDNLGEGDPG